MHGQFAWYELSTSDPKAAEKFYKTFTGWGAQPFDNDYTLFTSRGAGVAGVFTLTDELKSQGVPPNWMPYVEASNVAETAKLAASLGATIIHGPIAIPDVGDIAVIQDPQGAMFGLYKSIKGAPSWDGTPVIGNFSWNELMTTDHEKAFAFYKQLFGWEKLSEMDMGGGEMYWLFGKGDASYGGIFTRPKEMSEMHPFWLCYIHVKDVPKSLAVATKAGATVQRPPMPIPGGVIAILGDPQGAGIALHHADAAAPAASGPTKTVATKAVKAKKKKKKKKTTKAVAKKPAKAKKVAKSSSKKKTVKTKKEKKKEKKREKKKEKKSKARKARKKK